MRRLIRRLAGSKVGRTVTSVAGAIIGGGGTAALGVEIEFVVLIAATAFVAIFVGVEKAAKFAEIFKDDVKRNN